MPITHTETVLWTKTWTDEVAAHFDTRALSTSWKYVFHPCMFPVNCVFKVYRGLHQIFVVYSGKTLFLCLIHRKIDTIENDLIFMCLFWIKGSRWF